MRGWEFETQEMAYLDLWRATSDLRHVCGSQKHRTSAALSNSSGRESADELRPRVLGHGWWEGGPDETCGHDEVGRRLLREASRLVFGSVASDGDVEQDVRDGQLGSGSFRETGIS